MLTEACPPALCVAPPIDSGRGRQSFNGSAPVTQQGAHNFALYVVLYTCWLLIFQLFLQHDQLKTVNFAPTRNMNMDL